MATVPAPRTWTVGELLTASKMNTDLRDGLNFLLGGRPLVYLATNTGPTVASNSSAAVTWDVEVIDRDGGHSNVTNNSRYTAQTAGWYRVVAAVRWGASNTRTSTSSFLRKNGTTSLNTAAAENPGTLFNQAYNLISTIILLSVSDYLEVMAFQVNGSSSSLAVYADGASTQDTRFTAEWISKA